MKSKFFSQLLVLLLFLTRCFLVIASFFDLTYPVPSLFLPFSFPCTYVIFCLFLLFCFFFLSCSFFALALFLLFLLCNFLLHLFSPLTLFLFLFFLKPPCSVIINFCNNMVTNLNWYCFYFACHIWMIGNIVLQPNSIQATSVIIASLILNKLAVTRSFLI